MGFTIQVRYCQEVQSAPTKDWLKWDMFRRRYCFSQSDNESDWLDFDGIQERERDAVGLNHEKIPMPWITRPISHEFYDLFMPNPVSFTAGAPTNLDLLKPKSNISDDEKLKIENPEE
ncbi:hypothetical protein AWZ03_007638 [Drosophila navojoa]|uniref:Uncharacterized protein n=1 Tax=Drosophila navojoa TaxID=7232 RepID=A0A484BAZ9_DRONA|nr:hypothetical protein AWZ03_007638 [Drosophila navojoa]